MCGNDGRFEKKFASWDANDVAYFNPKEREQLVSTAAEVQWDASVFGQGHSLDLAAKLRDIWARVLRPT
eukprot:gene16605-22847_t